MHCRNTQQPQFSLIQTDEAVAKYILSTYKYDRQRDLKPNKLEELYNEMVNGNFDENLSTVIIGVVKGESALMIDFNHRMSIIGGVKNLPPHSFSYNLLYRFNHYNTIEELDDAYNKIDAGSGRVLKDHIKAKSIDTITGLSDTQNSVTISALKMIRGGLGSTGKTRKLNTPIRSYSTLVGNHVREINQFWTIVDSAPKNKKVIKDFISKSDMVAFSLIIIKEKPVEATNFLRDLLSPVNHASLNHPIPKLIEQIHLLNGLSTTRDRDRYKKAFNRFSLAWKRYCENKPLNNWEKDVEFLSGGKKTVLIKPIPYTSFNNNSSFERNGMKLFNI
jgi:hypothetical protein